MSNWLAIATVTEVLKTLLQSAITASSIPMHGTATTVRPDMALMGPDGSLLPAINIFLYRIAPNASLRNADLPTRAADGRTMARPQVALDLHYLLTFHGAEAELVPQRLLGLAMATLHAQPLLTRAMIQGVIDGLDEGHALKASDLANDIALVRLTPEALSVEDLSKLWTMFSQPNFALSAAWQASVVLIEASVTPQVALPVTERRVHVLGGVRRPVLEKVQSQEGEVQPIVASSGITLFGRDLNGEQVHVLIDGAQGPEPSTVGPERIDLELDSELLAGIHGAQVAHLRPLRGAEPRPFALSNVRPFVLHPRIVDDIHCADGILTVTISPEVAQTQRVALLLDPYRPETPNGRSYLLDGRLPDPPAGEPALLRSPEVVFALAGVEAGQYLVRVQVDGAESPLEQRPDGTGSLHYAWPVVVIP